MHNDACMEKQFTASAFVLNRRREILLVHHRKLGVWLYPGGHIHTNETPDQALMREVLEETGINIRILGHLDQTLADPAADVQVLHTPYRILCERIHDQDTPHYHIDMIYLCAALNGVCQANAEVHAARFFSQEETLKLTMFPNFKVLLRQVFNDASIWRQLDTVEFIT